MMTASNRWKWIGLAGLVLWMWNGGGFLSQAGPDLDMQWSQYRVIMWVGDTARRHPEKFSLFLQRLREMGVNTGMVYDGESAAPYWKAGFPYYVENLVNRGLCLKWNSRVRNWDAFVTQWHRSGRPLSALRRDYCLDDPQWIHWAEATVQRIAKQHRNHHPLAYNLRDELSVTISANPFDYDFNPQALAGFRLWLRSVYGSLEHLNQEWDTKFSRWEEVMPFTTDQIKERMVTGARHPRGKPDWAAVRRIQWDPQAARNRPVHWNFAPWADFRTYMDLSLARVLGRLRQAIRQIDPQTPVGIEGTQMPHAFGGYDLWRLSQVLDWVEPYDIAGAREIWGSFMPGKPMVTTVFEKETDPARRRLWHLLLLGDRGCIIWWSEDCFDWHRPEIPLTRKARALVPVLREMTSPLAQLFLRAHRELDPIYFHYSQASIQVDWLLESIPDGWTWYRRFSSYEAKHNRMAQVREGWWKIFTDLGYSPQWISYERLAHWNPPAGPAVLVLPTSRALSDAEAQAVRRFLNGSGGKGPRLLLADGSPGFFDGHGKLRDRSVLEDLFPPRRSEDGVYAATAAAPEAVRFRSGDIARYAVHRLAEKPRLDWAEWIEGLCQWLPREVRVPLSVRVRVYRYRLGPARLIALERNISYHMSENLAQAGGNEALEHPVSIPIHLSHGGWIYDLWTQKLLAHGQQVQVTIDPWRPTLLAVLPTRIPSSQLLSWLLAQAP